MTEEGKAYVNLFNEASEALVDAGDAYLKDYDRFVAIYVKMFHKYPNIIDLEAEGAYLYNKDLKKKNKHDSSDAESSDNEEELIIENDSSKETLLTDTSVVDIHKNSDLISLDDDDDDDEDKYRFKSINRDKTFIKMVETYTNAGIIRNFDYPIIILDNVIIFWHKYQHELTVLQDVPELYEWIAECVVENEDDEDIRYFEYVTYGQHGFDTIPLEVKKQDIDIAYNYNDSLPNDEIISFLTNKDSGIAILHGKPGTGKTSYIRHLIYSLHKKDFLVLDSSVFNYITDSSFITLLMEYKNAIIILEDSESMLVDRTSGNSKIESLLNLSDGIIGDAFNFKFICTFNANISKIDKALLRNGRMKIKYEFKALTPEKTQQLAKSIGKAIPEGESLTLADIYNYGVTNDFSDKDEKTIGFTKSKR